MHFLGFRVVQCTRHVCVFVSVSYWVFICCCVLYCCADIATTVTTRPVCQKDVCAVSSQLLFCNRFKSGKDIRFASLWKSFCVPEKAQGFGGIKLCRGGLMIRAVATLEKESTQSNQVNEDGGGYQSSTGTSIGSGNSTCSAIEGQSQTDESTKLDEIEKLRRSRISKANKGKTPWNKGRKHSPGILTFPLLFFFFFFACCLVRKISVFNRVNHLQKLCRRLKREPGLQCEILR